MEHLYNENSSSQHRSIEDHLRSCAQCRAQASRWRATMKSLDGWRLSSPRRSRILPTIPWAVAAMLVVGIGIGFRAGRGSSMDSPSFRAALHKEVAAQVTIAVDQQRAAMAEELRTASARAVGEETRQLLSAFAEQIDERRQSDAEAIYAAIQQVDARHGQDVARLRHDLGTVAVVADARLSDAQEQIQNLSKPVSDTTDK